MDAHVRPRLVYMRECVRARSCRATYALERMHGRIGRLVRASQRAKDDSLCGARTSCQGYAHAPTRAPYRWPVGARSVQRLELSVPLALVVVGRKARVWIATYCNVRRLAEDGQGLKLRQTQAPPLATARQQRAMRAKTPASSLSDH
jgi:hypothetical protein